MKIRSGGIIGMGESTNDRAGFVIELANLPVHPESVPINMLVKAESTIWWKTSMMLSLSTFIKLIAIARIMMP